MILNLAYSLILSVTVFMNLQGHAKEPKPPDYTEYVAEVTSSFLRQTYREYGFECGASGGQMPYDVEEISVQLVAYRSATVEQARELEVILTERFAEIINAHEKIRPFLREYPFPPSRVDVAISFENPKRNKKVPVADGEVTLVFQAKNKLFYQSDKPNGRYQYTDIMNEPYEEARKIVNKNMLKKPQQEPKNL